MIKKISAERVLLLILDKRDDEVGEDVLECKDLISENDHDLMRLNTNDYQNKDEQPVCSQH